MVSTLRSIGLQDEWLISDRDYDKVSAHANDVVREISDEYLQAIRDEGCDQGMINDAVSDVFVAALFLSDADDWYDRKDPWLKNHIEKAIRARLVDNREE